MFFLFILSSLIARAQIFTYFKIHLHMQNYFIVNYQKEEDKHLYKDYTEPNEEKEH